MADKDLWQVGVCIDHQFYLRFTAEKVVYENGIGFIEKNQQKNINDLACIALYPKEKSIAFCSGVVMCSFSVREGDLNDFVADYKVQFLGKEGIVSIEKAAE